MTKPIEHIAYGSACELKQIVKLHGIEKVMLTLLDVCDKGEVYNALARAAIQKKRERHGAAYGIVETVA